MSRFSLKNKIVVLTGAAGILGNTFCEALLESGAHVIGLDSNDVGLKELIQRQSSERLITYCIDIRDSQAVRSVREALAERFGRIDGLLNNAATKSENFFEPFETFPLEDWDYVMSVNLKGAFVCCQEFGGQMALQNYGCIVNVVSIYGIVAPDQRIYDGSEYLGRTINTPAVYSASKAGLLGLTRYLSSYWGGRNVRVNALTPGGIQSGQNSVFIDRYSQRVPLGRMGQVDDLVGALIFLLSDAAGYVTGQNIVVDGGWTVW